MTGLLRNAQRGAVLQAVILLRRYHRRRNIKTMNFDNPVYRKTTADELSLSIDRQQYQPVHASVHIPRNPSPVSFLYLVYEYNIK